MPVCTHIHTYKYIINMEFMLDEIMQQTEKLIVAQNYGFRSNILLA